MKKAMLFSAAYLLLFAGVACGGAPVNVSCGNSPKSLNKLHEGTFTVNCPVQCTQGSVWGSNNQFTTDSGICVAAVHEGVITPQGGKVVVKIGPGQAGYVGQTKNGVLTSSWGSYDSSFSVSRPQ